MRIDGLWCAFLAAGGVLALGSRAGAVVIASYPFDAGTTSPAVENVSTATASSTDSDANSAASPLQGGSGLLAWNNDDFPAVTTSTSGGDPVPSLYVRASYTGGTMADAVADNDYLAFTVTPNPGFQLNLTTLTFGIARNNAALSGSTFVVRSTATGATDLGSGVNGPVVQGTAPFSAPFGDVSVPLGLAALQGLTTPTEFRIYVYDGTNVDTHLNRIDNVVLDGTVTLVPEPSSALAAGTLAVTSLGRRRRRAGAPAAARR